MSAVSTAVPAPSPGRRSGGGFLAGAGGRLLPASVPLRWFGAALVFHALAWVALAAGASQWRDWRGGLGWPLAALHLITLGTLVASAVGASLQLLPVATRQPVRWPRLGALLWWAFVPGVAALALGMGLPRPGWIAIGASLVIAVLAIWGLLLAFNLRGARGMPSVVLHGWGAVTALAVVLGSAGALAALWNGHATPALGRDALRALHGPAGVLGVMGLLLLGLSTILLPMFALAGVPEERAQRHAGLAALVALALLVAAPLLPATTAPRAAALVAAAAALTLHVKLMQQVLRSGLRSHLGRSTRLLRCAWVAAALALTGAAIGLARDGAADDPWAAIAVVLAVVGWLLGSLWAILQRILPFLASMHAARGGARGRPPTPSSLSLEAPLVLHEVAHAMALALLVCAVATRAPAWLLAACACGLAGALAWLVYFGVLLLRLRRATVARVAVA